MSPPPAKRRRLSQNLQLQFPEPILYYLKNNAAPELLLKLMQLSKYFCYTEFPFMVVKELKFEYDSSTYNPLNPSHKYDGEKDFWITEYLHVDLNNSSFALALTERIAVCNIRKLYLENQELTMEEFEFFNLAKLFEVSLYDTVITGDDDDDEVLSIDKILQKLPLICEFEFAFRGNSLLEARMSSETTKNIIELMDNSCIFNTLNLYDVPETFDIDAFMEFAHDTNWIDYELDFNYDISDEYTQKLQVAVDQIIEKNSEYGCRSLIFFPGQSQESINELFSLRKKFYNELD